MPVSTFATFDEIEVLVHTGAVPGVVLKLFLAVRGSKLAGFLQRVSYALVSAQLALQTRSGARTRKVKGVEHVSHEPLRHGELATANIRPPRRPSHEHST